MTAVKNWKNMIVFDGFVIWYQRFIVLKFFPIILSLFVVFVLPNKNKIFRVKYVFFIYQNPIIFVKKIIKMQKKAKNVAKKGFLDCQEHKIMLYFNNEI